jgi:hypothetical protein
MQFLGINLTENYTDGELDDCKNLSTLQYPTLTQRKGRALLEGYEDASDLYEWDGHLVVVSNGTLYVNGEPVCSVEDGKKQFAVVNSRLIVFPDKISVDLRNGEFMQLDVSVQTPGTSGSAVFTSNSLKAPLEYKVSSGSGEGVKNANAWTKWGVFWYTYGTDITAVRECWDEATLTWDMEALETLKITWIFDSTYDDVVPNAVRAWTENVVGQIFIPGAEGISSYPLLRGNVRDGVIEDYPDTSKYNTEGIVGIITWVDDEENYDGKANRFKWKRDIIDVTSGNQAFSKVFGVGDMVDISGTLYELLDTTHAGDDTTTSSKLKITGIIDATESQANALVFADNTFKVPHNAFQLTQDYGPGKYYMRVNTSGSEIVYCRFITTKKMLKDQVLVLYGTASTETLYVWDIGTHKFVYEMEATLSSSTPSSSYTNILPSGQTYVRIYDTSGQVITIRRSIPDLDYICERDNRLWGVSNNDKTIYCSALGLPWVFYDYSGLDTDSYAVAVGSAGNFTGIASYGGVVCFKENKIHKMLGSFPSDFYMTTYDVAGIQEGASGSAVIVNEVLYYRSPLGVMAFTGFQPSNISPNLSLENTKGGIGGTNGREYFLCVQAKDHSHYTLYKYDLQEKLWIKEEDVNVTSMANIGNDFYIVICTEETVTVEGQTIIDTHYTPYQTGQENEEGMGLEWFARFKPYSNTSRFKSGYTRIVLRFEMAPGSSFTVKTRCDGGQWVKGWSQVCTNKLSHTVPLRIGRCDKFEIMLEGKGQTKIRSIEREFVQGGWHDGTDFY